ncbi:MAG: tRNA uridine-5-carboxymethylaminomethyl(34) synthesis GTPase MnmE [Clostridia bacterium]|nr:tRNA uridine-5-carboxymethylaminomethyl(34) synthesis GTPase MnmE [Clostridia bacterium]
MSKVIAAISTPISPAGLGVIRVSGDGAVELAAQVFSPVNQARALTALAGYQAAYGHVADAEGVIDECVATVFRAPHSYTGEDVVEFSCHGGVYLLQRTLRALFAVGAAPAAAGEFTRRAFLNGKMDLTRAEAVMDLIGAEGRLAAKTALATREGAVFQALQPVKEQLIDWQAQIAAFVDYPDDDIPELDPLVLENGLENAVATLSRLLESYDAGRILRAGVDTVIVGSPNVGKSTLMNCLAGCDRSIVTDVAGTTRDVVEESVRVGELTLRLSDTAGIRDTEDQVEAIGVERSRKRLESAALILAVFDSSRELSSDDKALIDSLPKDTTIAILNKQDLSAKVNKEYIIDKFQHTVCMEAANGSGKDELIEAITRVTGLHRLDEAEPVLASERQRDCVVRAREALQEAVEAVRAGLSQDAVAVSVDGALAALLELTGERATEAVVNGIFARFCVGK